MKKRERKDRVIPRKNHNSEKKKKKKRNGINKMITRSQYRRREGWCSLHDSYNENGLRLTDFAVDRQMAIKSTYILHTLTNPLQNLPLSRRPHQQPGHYLIDRRHFSDVIDGAE
jgi:hypothetical protein